MARKAHKDGEIRPPRAALEALDAWLDANGARRANLAESLSVSQAHLHRVFAGTGYLSKSQRAEVEEFTEGGITEAMLEGKQALPKRPTKKRAPVEESFEECDSSESSENLFEEYATRSTPSALKIIHSLMATAKSESLRAKCAETIIEHGRGKARQYEKQERLEAPVVDEELIRKLSEIESRLTGRPLDDNGHIAKIEFEGQGIA